MDPISIESINAEGKNLTITFFTPFSIRTHSLESKSDLGQAWMAVEGVNLVDLGEGRYRAHPGFYSRSTGLLSSGFPPSSTRVFG